MLNRRQEERLNKMATLVQTGFASGSPVIFDNDNLAGNLLLVLVYVEKQIADPVFTCEDDLGNTYIGLGIRISDDGNSYGELFYSIGIAAGTNAIRAHVLDGTTELTGIRVMCHEFSAVNSFSDNNFASGTGLSQNSGTVSAPADAFLFGYQFSNLTRGQTAIFTGTDWTEALLFGSPGPNGFTQYRNVTAAGDYASVTTSTVGKGGSCHWVEEVVVFV